MNQPDAFVWSACARMVAFALVAVAAVLFQIVSRGEESQTDAQLSEAQRVARITRAHHRSDPQGGTTRREYHRRVAADVRARSHGVACGSALRLAALD